MRHPVRLLAMAAVLLAVMCACDVLFMGRYGSDLGQAVAYADLSAGVTAYDAPSFSLSIVTRDETEYVLLFSDTDFDAAAAHLYVLSPDLAVLNAFTQDEIEALDPPGVAFRGSTAMTLLTDGRIIIGNVVAEPAAETGLTLVNKLATPLYSVNAALDGWAIEGPSTMDYVCTNFSTNPADQTFSFSAYLPFWGGVSIVSGSLGASAKIQGVFSDPTDPENNVALLAFSVENENTTSFFQLAKDPDLATGFSGYPLFTAYTPITKSNLKNGTIATTEDGIVAYDSAEAAWIWFSPSDPGKVKSLPVRDWDSDRKTAFSFSNGWYCVWDPAARTLTRYEKWW